MTFYERMGIGSYINAHDTYTIYGGSRMAPETLEAMREASESFVDMEQMQRALGARIAEMTRNEGAFISNGAAGALTLAAAVCMAKGSQYHFSRLPDSSGMKNEVIVMRCQRNAYDKAISAAGAKIVEIGDADETPDYELEGSINENTAAVFYFQSLHFARASMPLEDAIRIAHAKGVPVVVDAAAQLPPVENLWKFTQMGADLALFSGGKTLCGPQDSGLILGRADMIADCVRFGAPAHGVCRGSKTSREAMAGLYVALERYLALDPSREYARLEAMAKSLGEMMREVGIKPEIVPYGPVGQTYPRIFGQCGAPGQAVKLGEKMKARGIYIGVEPLGNRIYFSPLNLTDYEARQAGDALREIMAGEV